MLGTTIANHAMIWRMTDIANFFDSLGKRVRLARDYKGMSGRELARLVTISPSMIAKVERDQKEPSLDLLVKIADALDVSLDWLTLKSGVSNPHQHKSASQEPVYYSPEADEAGKLIDAMTPKWRAKALVSIHDIAERERDYQQNERLIRQLMASIEAKQGREALEEIIRQFSTKIRADSV